MHAIRHSTLSLTCLAMLLTGLAVPRTPAGNPDIPEVRITLSASAFTAVNTAAEEPKVIKSCTAAFRYPGESTDRFSVGCQIRNHGAAAVHDYASRRSFRLKFKAAYGPKRLDYPVFERAPLHATTRQGFDNLVLRGGGNDNPGFTFYPLQWGWTYCMDEFIRATQLDMTGVGNHGTFCSLFINGSYWGLYNLTERADRAFAGMWLGGNKDDWISARDVEGDLTRWHTTYSLAKSAQSYSIDTLVQYLDLESFADYMILGMTAGNWDWSESNSWNVTRKNGKTHFFMWDAEHAFAGVYKLDMVGHQPLTDPVRMKWSSHPAPHLDMFFGGLIRNSAFKQIFSDRARLHLKTTGGALTDAKMRARWGTICSFVRPDISRDTSRWGLGSLSQWESNIVKARNLFSGNADAAFNAFNAKGWIVAPSPTPPSAPSGLTAAAQSWSQIRLTWQDNSGDEDGFRIDRRVSGVTEWTADHASVGAGVTSYTDTGLTAETKYYYRVRAYSAAGVSVESNVADATTPANPAGPADWAQLPTLTTNHLEEVQFVSATTGWAVGWHGTILKTTNGGTSWTFQNSGVTEELISLHFVSASKGWVVGYNGTLLYTDNGGATWQKKNLGTSNGLQSVYFVDENTGWVFGNGRFIRKTTDGGATWQAQTCPISTFLLCGRFIDRNVGYVSCGNGQVLKTTNGGATWTALSPGSTGYMLSLAVLDANTVWVCGQDGVVYRTTDGGASWTLALNTGYTAHSIFFVDRNRAYIGSNGARIYETLNGGGSWGYQRLAQWTLSVHWPDASHGYAVGGNGVMYRTTLGDPGPQPPAAPSGLAATASSASAIEVSWTDNSPDEAGFKLDRRQTGTTDWIRVAELGANATRHTDSGLPAGTKFYYQVKAYNAAGNSAYSNIGAATTASAAQPAIAVSTTNISVSCASGADAADVTFQVWNGGSGTLAYTLVESSSRLDVAPGSGTSTGSAAKQTHTVTFHTASLALGTHERTITVQDDGSGAVPASVDIAVSITVAESAPAAPGALAAAALSDSRIRLSWQDNSDNETGFRIDRRQSGTADWTADHATVAADVSLYTDAGLPAETKFYYRVKAYNAAGISPVSAVADATTRPAAGIGYGAVWAYRKGTAEASAPASAWRRPDFDDSAWNTGNAPFGYGDGPYGMTLADMRNSYTSLFLRKAFGIQQPALVSELRLAALYDDGFVMWLNGAEIARVNVNGAPAFDAAASATVGDGTPWSRTYAGGELPELREDNVLAVMVLNAGADSSDLTLELELSVVRSPLPVAEDADQDAMPDEWETLHLSELSDPSDRSDSADPDGDGHSNVEEYIAGTDPVQNGSWFMVDVRLQDGAPVVSFPTVAAAGAGYAGKTRYYALQHLVPFGGAAAWASVAGMERIEGTGSTVTHSPAAAGSGTEQFRARVWLEEQ
ncbi:MAG: fibronectin type III domain-containing protein [Kiritimatiellae bacterium]|nr:fibronectin type III domain-containing protein [Kiritimatiellia bacterium]